MVTVNSILRDLSFFVREIPEAFLRWICITIVFLR